MAAVTVSRSEGRLIAVKQVSAERASEVEREADLLKRLDHPGLVRFVDIVETADGGRALHTEFVSSDTWTTRPLTDPAERAAGMAALAAVVADLHHLGVAHLQLTPGHVLHGDNDRPVLCGMTLAAEATSENRHTDLAALADLCHDPSLERGALNGKLSLLADAARAGRLSARELARRLDLLAAKRASGAEPVRAVGGSVREGLKRRCRPKSLLAAGAVTAAVVVAFALGSWSRGPERSAITPAGAPGQTPSNADLTGPGLIDGSGSIDRSGLIDESGPADGPGLIDESGPVTGPGLIDESGPVTGPGLIDGADLINGAGPADQGTAGALDGPSDTSGDASSLAPAPAANDASTDTPVSLQEAAAVLEHGGRRYAVGATGDFVETGDWDCDGQATAAIVRPSTGGVVLFDVWPDPGETIALPVRWNVDSPTGAEAIPHGQCDLLRVYTTAGSRLFNPREAP